MPLQEFCEARGVTGNEDEIRTVICDEIRPSVDRMVLDNIGNIVAVKDGRNPDFKVLICAHMDEVGGMVTGISENGFIKFYPVGEVDVRVLPAKKVMIGDQMIPGVIGIRSVHLQKPEKRAENVSIEDLYIDIGAEKKEEAEKLVHLADYIVYQSDYMDFGVNFIKAKALDNRTGCAMIAELLTKSYDFELTAAFTVQEEVGCRGAAVISNYLDFNIALVVSTVSCDDAFDTEEHKSEISLGKGPVVFLGKHCNDKSVLMLQKLETLAIRAGIGIQTSISIENVYEAERLRQSSPNGEVVSLGIPCRNIHSPNCIISKTDYVQCKELISLIFQEFCH